jgi:predicted transcriptional regulator
LRSERNKPCEQAQQDSDNYWQAVENLAEQIVEELGDAEADDRDELLHRLLHENTEQHEYVINDDLQLHVLRHSKHPCAALFNGTLSGGHQSTDDFPFAAFAGDAFEADVSAKVKELLDENKTPA